MTSKSRGGRRYLPYALTEQGVAMLSSVLRSSRAIAANIEIMRVFVKLREVNASHAHLARKLDELEKRYDASAREVSRLHDGQITSRARSVRRIARPGIAAPRSRDYARR